MGTRAPGSNASPPIGEAGRRARPARGPRVRVRVRVRVRFRVRVRVRARVEG